MLARFLRKVRSALIVAAVQLRSRARVAWLRIWMPELTLGPGVFIGRGVRFKAISGGTIRIGAGSAVEDLCYLHAEGGELVIGPDTFVGFGSHLVAVDRLTIGRDVMIATGCVIRDADHRFDRVDVPIGRQGRVAAPIDIGDDVWLGAHVVVTAGSSIGKGCVIGANAVVRGVIPDYSVAVGVPAKVIRSRRPVAPETSL